MSAKPQQQSDDKTNYTGVGLAIGLTIGAGLQQSKGQSTEGVPLTGHDQSEA
jgi:hypothetical protein